MGNERINSQKLRFYPFLIDQSLKVSLCALYKRVVRGCYLSMVSFLGGGVGSGSNKSREANEISSSINEMNVIDLIGKSFFWILHFEFKTRFLKQLIVSMISDTFSVLPRALDIYPKNNQNFMPNNSRCHKEVAVSQISAS